MGKKDTVKRVAKKLDKINPNWYNHVDLDKLNMREIDSCVMGQLAYNGIIKSDVKMWQKYPKATCSKRCSGEYTSFCNKQQAKWVKQIEKRREGDFYEGGIPITLYVNEHDNGHNPDIYEHLCDAEKASSQLPDFVQTHLYVRSGCR